MGRKSAFVVSTAILAMAVLAPSAQAVTEPSGSSAFGLAATDLLGIAPMPAVRSEGGRPARMSVTEQPENKLINAEALEVNAQGDRADSKAVGVKGLERRFTADAVQVQCSGGQGRANMVGAVVDGTEVGSAPPPNTAVPVRLKGYGTATVTLNKQQRNADGGMTITGVSVAVPVGDGQYRTVDLASATCGGAASVPVAVDDRGPLPEAAPPVTSKSTLPVAG
ncbi:choice-of-anchor P family protein [Nonomuraea sp. NPDC050790]|uniref:choice-of-anchor P family protein n=1 Tax=Nonomuraea sp. NPDC050790 TaxID=3364371 RepID=UPI0037B1F88D